ncbi:hypothetical protein FHU37_004706 [Allostreptomyces psammosilenae]|uniref:Uncharacterized protein n=1 Tax=Allostreptomyces psammosilenae TaxID=1892865 RepID=A0A853A0M0_9ACTN|nr:hypothetical protein [Allostreptomyces psammosilenae]
MTAPHAPRAAGPAPRAGGAPRPGDAPRATRIRQVHTP